MVDARKPLTVLNDAWSSCTACDLGKRRKNVDGYFVAGQGQPGGIMFIGEGPGANEEEQGIPFIGKSGQLLRDALQKLNFTHFYITNIVTCRSCETVIDPETNLPRMRKAGYGRPASLMYRDCPPKPLEIKECLPRLYEEIYLVDPVLIVTLGGTAAEALLKRNVAITNERGRPEAISVPGATSRAMHTDKRQVWGRKVHGEMKFPIEQNEVKYLVLPTLHPAYVLRKIGDKGERGEVRQFGTDLRAAVKIYERHMSEVMGVDPGYLSATTDADLSEIGIREDAD